MARFIRSEELQIYLDQSPSASKDGCIMPAPKGSPKHGGRQKGTPNKSTQNLLLKAEELSVDPFEILLLYVKRDWKALGFATENVLDKEGFETSVPRISMETQIECAKEVCQYIYPKRKAIELSGDLENPVQISMTLDDRKELLKAARSDGETE